MKRIENPHVAAAEGNRRQIKNIPEIIHRRRKHLSCLPLLPPSRASRNPLPATIPQRKAWHLFLHRTRLCHAFSKRARFPSIPAVHLNGGSRRKRGITRNCRIWRAVSGQNGKFPAIRIIFSLYSGHFPEPVRKQESGGRPKKGNGGRPAWPTGNGHPTR